MEKPCYGCGKPAKACQCAVRRDFVDRCKNLEIILNPMIHIENSPRVIVCVLCEMVKNILIEDRDQYDPNGALDQVIAGVL